MRNRVPRFPSPRRAERLLLLAMLAALQGAATMVGAESAASATDIQHPLVIPPPDAAGGGWADGGPAGAYFANASLAGEPAFIRHDVRVAFDWGQCLPVGGSPAEPYRSFPRDEFSIRWTGRVVPRFGEDYVFTVRSAGGARLKLKPAGAADWTLALEAWDKAGSASSRPIPLAAGAICEVVLEYHHRSGPAGLTLSWSCPSVTEQVVDSVVSQGLNAGSYMRYCWADALKLSRYLTDKQKVDDLGCPMTNCQFVVGEGEMSLNGTYALSFQGQAKVAVGQTAFESKYDQPSNTTQALIRVGNPDSLWILTLSATARHGDGEAKPANDGVSDVHLMRPIQPGATTAHRVDEIVYRPFKAAVAPYTCLRWLQMANWKCDGQWSSRTIPARREFTRGGIFDNYQGGECWEYLIVLANECGKDLYVCLPIAADANYLEQFARLVRYGSDGVTAYDHEVADPRWPPLNPNLHLYVEMGNEIWNWSFGSTQESFARAADAKKLHDAEGKIIDYDGKADYRRWYALRTVQASEVFRRISGDAAMGSRVRMLLEYQYDNLSETAKSSLDFIEQWFNNGDDDHVAEPHPVRHWIWGGGAATYYGVGNTNGLQREVRLADPSFENGVVPDGGESAAPAGSGWTCAGHAAIYRNRWVSIDSFTPGKGGVVPNAVAVGCAFRVTKPLYLRELGCWLRANAGPHTLHLIGPSGPMAKVNVKPAKFTMHEDTGWVWATVAGAPQLLEPGVDYRLLAKADKGGPNLFQDAVAVKAGPGFEMLGAIKASGGGGPEQWRIESAGDDGRSFGPVAIRATSAADTKSDLPSPFMGGQAAVLRGGGTLTTTIAVAKAGHYALALHSFGPPDASKVPAMPFGVTIDGKSVNPLAQGDDRLGPDRFGIGGWERRINQPDEVWGSGVFEVQAPGEVELKISAADKGAGWTAFDDVSVTSVDALMDSGFGAGQANGQVAQASYAKQLNNQARYPRSFGLPVVAYEAGWSLGGDYNATPIQSWCKFHDPRATSINTAAEDMFMESGGCMNVWGVYLYWPQRDMLNARTYPLAKSIAECSARLPAEAVNGIALPGRLETRSEQLAFSGFAWGSSASDFPKRGVWKSWLAVAPTSGVWTFAVKAKGDGVWELEIDGTVAGSGSGAGSTVVRLVKGQHGIRLRDRSGSFSLDGIEVSASTP
jgi:hypothetical protein